MAHKIALLALASEKHPWQQIQTEAQQPLFLNQASDEVVPLWVYGRPASSKEQLVIKRIEQQIRRDRYLQMLSALVGTRPIGWKPDRLSRQLTALVGNYDESRVRRVKNNIYLDVPEGLATLGLKTLWALEYLNQNESFSSIVRTNTSSFFDFEKLYEYINKRFPLEYAGYNIRMGKVVCASGAGTVLSQERVKSILNHKELWNHGFMDDQALGVLSRLLDFESPTHMPRFDFDPVARHSGEIDDAASYAAGHFHWRCKSFNFDIEIARMKELALAIQERKKP